MRRRGRLPAPGFAGLQLLLLCGAASGGGGGFRDFSPLPFLFIFYFLKNQVAGMGGRFPFLNETHLARMDLECAAERDWGLEVKVAASGWRCLGSRACLGFICLSKKFAPLWAARVLVLKPTAGGTLLFCRRKIDGTGKAGSDKAGGSVCPWLLGSRPSRACWLAGQAL